MSTPVFKVMTGSVLPCRPRGSMKYGWIPGTIVSFVPSDDQSYLNVVPAAEYYNTMGQYAIGHGGFTLNGSYELFEGFDFRFANDNEKSGRWTPDECVQYSKSEENNLLGFEPVNKQLTKQGKDLCSVNYDGGCFKIYTFEKYDNEYIQSNGESGSEINWKANVGRLMGVSPRSLFTTADNNVIDEVCEYRVGNYCQDENGRWYIFAVRR